MASKICAPSLLVQIDTFGIMVALGIGVFDFLRIKPEEKLSILGCRRHQTQKWNAIDDSLACSARVCG